MKVKQIVGAYTTYVSEEAKITKSDTTGVEITADDGVKTTLPPEKAAALTPDPANPNEYDLNPTATSPTGDTPEGPKVGANVEIKTAEAISDDLSTMPTDEYVKGIYAAAAENGMDAPEAEAVKKQMVLAPNGEVDIMATMQKAVQVFQSPEFKQMLADLDALVKQAEAQQASNPELARIQELAGTDIKSKYDSLSNDPNSEFYGLPDEAIEMLMQMPPSIKVDPNSPAPDLLAPTRDTKWPQFAELMKQIDALKDQGKNYDTALSQAMAIPGPVKLTAWFRAYAETLPQNAQQADVQESIKSPVSMFRKLLTILAEAPLEKNVDNNPPTKKSWGTEFIKPAPVDKIAPDTPTPTPVTPKAAPKAAPHKYVPGATWNKGVLGIGSTGPEVDELRRRLGLAPNGGKFDNETRDAVIQRQKELGVTADGAWGPGTARADAAKPKQTAPMASANDGDAGEAEGRANRDRMTTPPASANDGDAGEAEARPKQIARGYDMFTDRKSFKTDSVEVNINGSMYQMFLNSDGHYYIPGENVPRQRNGQNVYRPGERMPMQGPKTAPFPRGYQGTSQMESADNQLLKTMLTIAGLRS